MTPTGVGTLVEQGKRTLEIDGRLFLLELPLRANFSLINARRADHIGNLAYAMTARNFNPLMAMAADLVIAESQQIVPVGVIAPECKIYGLFSKNSKCAPGCGRRRAVASLRTAGHMFVPAS